MRRPSSSTIVHQHAAQMRAAPTTSEAVLWSALKGSQLGVGFRRQVPMGRYILDFYAPAAKLAVEVDGGWHADRARLDAKRDRVLARLGVRVLRLDAALVMGDLLAAVAAVRAALDS